MDSAINNPINDNDYVLFQETYDLESCVGKIVIALLSENDLSHLVVKRLIKYTSTSEINLKYSYTHTVRYILRSESRSTENVYKDIVDGYQIVGDVIAIAKPIIGN